MALIDTIVGTIGSVLDKVIPDKNKRLEAQEQLQTVMCYIKNDCESGFS